MFLHDDVGIARDLFSYMVGDVARPQIVLTAA
jgi:hypothetical protein